LKSERINVGAQPDAGRRMQTFSCDLIHRNWLSDTTFEIELTRPAGFEFLSGQNLCFQFRGVERYFAVLSSTADPHIKLCVYRIETGIFTPFLASANIGIQLTFTGPHGHFIFRPSKRRPIFVATGTGIVPFMSMSRSGVKGFTLLHLVPRDVDLYYKDYFEKAAEVYVPCVPNSTSGGKDMLELPVDMVLSFLSEHLPTKAYDFYLCGNQSMIRDVTLFIDSRYPDSMVYTEVFYRSIPT
jgi:ferredoxin-NADP reductase